jgi:PAS domain S-box-containing protein
MLKDETVQMPIKDSNPKPLREEPLVSQEQLRVSLDRYQSLAEITGILGWTTNADGEVVEDIPSFRKFTGLTYEEIKGWGWSKALHPDDLERTTQIWKKATEKRINYETEYRLRRYDGVYRDFIARSVPLLKEDGSIREWVGVCIDVTERKKAEIEAGSAQEKYVSLCQNIPGMVYRARPDWSIEYVSESKSVCGYTIDELNSGKINWLSIIHPDDKERVMAEGAPIRSRAESITQEYRIIDREGNVRWVEDHKTSSFSNDGALNSVDGVVFDVTERKMAEDALRKSESKYRTLLENIPQKIFFKDKNLVYVSCNENYARDLEIKSNEIAGKTDYDFYPKELAEKYRADDQRIMKSGKTADIEDEYVQDGQKAFVHTVKTPVKDENDNVVGIIGIFWDVTGQKKAKEALRESEGRLKQLIECAPDAIYVNDLKGNFIDGNKQAEDLTGYSREELIGKNMLKVGLLPRKYAPTAIKSLMKSVLGQKTGPDAFELVRKDGRRVNVEISTFPVKRGGKVEVVGIARDITVRKEMEEKLRQYSEHLEELVKKRSQELLESEKRYSAVVEDASDGVALLQDGKIVFVNKKSLELIGYSKDELIGLPFMKLVSEKYYQIVQERYERRIAGEPVKPTYEIELIAKNGEHVPVELSAAVVGYQGRPADSIIVRDVRERKQMEEQRSRLEKLAAIGEMATMVGHDLRNPLQSIDNTLYVLENLLGNCMREHSVPCQQQAGKMLQVISGSVDYASNIVRDLQDFSAIIPPKLENVDVNAIIKEVLGETKTPSNVEIVAELRLFPEISLDKYQMKRVFSNLVINALQAMESGGALTVSSEQAQGFVEICFRDTGKGIPRERMEKLFKAFSTTKARGMGMGLAICKKFVEGHGGSINVESEVGRGTTFKIRLPIRRGDGGEDD